MWTDVKYKEELKLNQLVRVKFTGHEARISKIIAQDEFGQELHCLVYLIDPKDPKDFGGHWYFSHCFEKYVKRMKLDKCARTK